MARVAEDTEQRVLVLAPIGRDAKAAALHLEENGIPCVVCSNLKDLVDRLNIGAAVAVVTEEAFLRGTSDELNVWVKRQPPWSDFPFTVLTSHQASAFAQAHRLRLLENLGNVSLLERPFGAVTLVSTVQAALRARRRQYGRFGSICSLGKMPPLSWRVSFKPEHGSWNMLMSGSIKKSLSAGRRRQPCSKRKRWK